MPATFPFLGSQQVMETAGQTIAKTNVCNWPYQLNWSNTCPISDPYGVVSYTTAYLDIEFSSPEPVEEYSGTENSKGEVEYTRKVLRNRFSCDIIANDEMVWALFFMKLHDRVELVSLKGGGAFELKNITLVKDDAPEDLTKVTMSFEVKDNDIDISACDCNFNGPYEDDCDDTGGGGEPPEDPCDGFEVNITKTGDVLYTAVTNQPPSTTVKYRWYYHSGNGNWKVISQSAENITLGAFGTYRVVAQAGECEDVEDFLYQDPCALIVTLAKVGEAGLTATILGGSGSEVITWTFIDEQGMESQLGESGTSIVGTETGYYRIKVMDGENCEREAMEFLQVGEDNGCTLTGSIAESGGILTVTYAGCTGPANISWAVDRGDGGGSTLVGSGPTVAVDGNGMYVATVTCGLCEESFYYVLIACEDDPGGGEDCGNLGITIQRSGETLNASPSGCNGQYEIKWYKNTGSGYGSTIGSGNSFPIDGNGMYKAELVCGDCTASSEFLVFDCDVCTGVTVAVAITDDQITATPAGCPGGSTTTYTWVFDDGTGETPLPNTTATITASAAGIYRVTINCDNCEAKGGVLYTGCETCEPITTGVGGTFNVC